MAPRKPRRLESLPPDQLVHLDVREDIRHGKEPLARIMAAVDILAPEQVLVLRAPFEPIPLYRVLTTRGFTHWAEAHATDDWSVWFWREDQPVEPLRVDVRGLEPPVPMVRILNLLEQLAPGQRLMVTHERRPVLLYPQLDERGFQHTTEEAKPGEFRITIWHAET